MEPIRPSFHSRRKVSFSRSSRKNSDKSRSLVLSNRSRSESENPFFTKDQLDKDLQNKSMGMKKKSKRMLGSRGNITPIINNSYKEGEDYTDKENNSTKKDGELGKTTEKLEQIEVTTITASDDKNSVKSSSAKEEEEKQDTEQVYKMFSNPVEPEQKEVESMTEETFNFFQTFLGAFHDEQQSHDHEAEVLSNFGFKR